MTPRLRFDNYILIRSKKGVSVRKTWEWKAIGRRGLDLDSAQLVIDMILLGDMRNILLQKLPGSSPQSDLATLSIPQ